MNDYQINKIIVDTLLKFGFDDDYIKYSSYKYKMFYNSIENDSDYNSICTCMNLYFDKKEEKILFKILNKLGWKANRLDNYYFTKIK